MSDSLDVLYFGDRYCNSIFLDFENETAELRFDMIIVRQEAQGHIGTPVTNGRLVFRSVERFGMEPAGQIPNDYIHDWRFTTLPDGRLRTDFWIDAVSNAGGPPVNTHIEIISRSVEMRGE